MNQRRKPIAVPASRVPRPGAAAFTLIELSIVLVIIGLIVGGVLVGQNLIAAAGLRATISQIERYNTAVHTFQTKYNALPGDIADPAASSFGFIARGTYPGQGDGNGIIEGAYNSGGQHSGLYESQGETVVFWRDLSTANLIDGGFASAVSSGGSCCSSTYVPLYFPAAKLGNGNSFYVWSGGPSINNSSSNGQNYFGIAIINAVGGGSLPESLPGLTVAQAQSIDSKIDDGLPQSGNVTAVLVYSQYAIWSAGGGGYGASTGFQGQGNPTTAATPGSATTCYDNGGAGGATQQYSVEISGGANINCALSFRFQ
jgi:prepilin-type N-terminal cleavage/methylation domain-containing protein